MKDLILKHALINAIKHGGKAEIDAVVSKVIAEQPELKKEIKKVVACVGKVVKKVNSLSLEEQCAELKKLGIKIEERKIKERLELPPLPNAKKGKVVLRLAPYPSGPLHIGNARAVILNDEYAKKYCGKLFLVYDDTIGSEEKFVLKEAYELIEDSLSWLGVKIDKTFYKSDRLELYYNFAEKLIKAGLAYVCECDVGTLRRARAEGIECEHRAQSVEENLEKWKAMLEGRYAEGEAVLRLKTDMKHPNPAFRDRVLFRIVERAHPRVGKKYRVWPMLEVTWVLDDHELGVTHIIRGKDLVMEDMVEDFIWQKLGLKRAEFIHYGMLSLEEAKISKTEARRAIERGIYSGWDDPRTWSLQSLRKRGIQPQAIRNFVLRMGLSETDVSVPAEILYAENRKLIDSVANRYFALLDPVKISVKGAPKIKKVKVPLHPDFPDRGYREVPVNVKEIYIERNDLEKFEGQEVGLINLFTVKLGREAEFLSKEIKMEIQKIQWVSEPNVKIKILMPDGSLREAIAEPQIRKVKADELVQFMRVGFARCDKPGFFYFGHK